MPDDVHETVAQKLRRTRQRYTSGRRGLVELLLELERPAAIPELLEQGAAQSQSSLYRNLGILEQCGAVRRIGSVDDAARYELSEELTGHHHHLVCNRCGRVEDVVLPNRVERALGDAAAEAMDQAGFEVDSHRFELVGTCPDCA